MKVMHVISGLSAGGAEHFVLNLCRESRKDANMKMSVVSLGASNEIAHKFHDAGIELTTKNAAHAFQFLLKQPGTVIHAHMFHACVIACFVKLFRPSVKIIFTLHNNYVPKLHRKLFLYLTKPLRKTDVIFPGMKRKWFQKKDAVIIPNGVDVNRFPVGQNKPAVFTFAFVGRLEHEKNPLFLIDLAKQLTQKNFLIKIAGDGLLRKVVEEKIKTENLEHRILLHGYVDDVSGFLSASHCLLLPSLWEGMPLVLLEAGAAETPVIATPVGNIPSLLSENEGYISAIHSFSKTAEQVIDHYEEALGKARNFKAKVLTAFSISTCYARHKEVYSH